MPKQIDKQKKKDRILEAAIRVFSKNGLKSTKIADIAAAAEIGKGTVYEYFNSKDEIFNATFFYFMEKVADILNQRVKQLEDPLEKLMAFFSTWSNIMDTEYLHYFEIVLEYWAEGIRSKEDPQSFDLAQLFAGYRQTIMELLQECIDKGEIMAYDTNITASILLGALDGIFLQWITDPSAFDLKRANELLGKIFIGGLKKE